MSVGFSSSLIAKGKAQYDILLPSIQKQHFGHYIVIEPISHEYFINSQLAVALRTAKNKFPDREFYSAKIGSETAITFSQVG